jgi:hypothetical protein
MAAYLVNPGLCRLACSGRERRLHEANFPALDCLVAFGFGLLKGIEPL